VLRQWRQCCGRKNVAAEKMWRQQIYIYVAAEKMWRAVSAVAAVSIVSIVTGMAEIFSDILDRPPEKKSASSSSSADVALGRQSGKKHKCRHGGMGVGGFCPPACGQKKTGQRQQKKLGKDSDEQQKRQKRE
jgi:hypothetical protein